jgi:putative ABC transport system permease protein
MKNLFRDLRYGARSLLKKPGFTLIAIFTLALGIGANAGIFSLINAALFRPLPYADEGRLVVLREVRTDDPQSSKGVSYLNFVDWRAQSRSFESMAIATTDAVTFKAEGEPLRVTAAVVSADLFQTLGVRPLLGRAFDASDERGLANAGINPVILTYSAWRKYFGGEPKVLGRALTVNEKRFQVVGVTPPGIFPLREEPVEFWMTTAVNGNAADQESANGSRNFRAYPGVVARLKPGVSPRQAQAELAGIQAGLQSQYPKAMANRAVLVEPLRELFVRDAKGTLWLLLGVVGAVLLIACVNVANVQLSRAVARRREIAVRSALGASRWDIARQLLVESSLLALSGGALGLLLSMWMVDGVTALLPANAPRLAGLTPDWRVLLFTFGASLLTGALCGLTPALTATRGSLAEVINEGGRSAAGGELRGRLRDVLVIGQVAVALTLLAGAGLLVKSLIRLTDVRPGFDTRNTLTMQMSLSGERYDDPQFDGKMENPWRANAFLSELTERVKRLPGVTDVASAQCVPLTGIENNTGFRILGDTRSGEKPSAQLRFISPGYFHALGIPLVAGRDFTDRDNPQSAPVMLVNEAFAREHFGGENPLGKKLGLGWGGDAPKEVVGVVGNVRHRSLSDSARAEMYVPQAQFANAGITLIVRSRANPESLINSVKQQIRALDPELPVTDIKTLDAYRDEALATPRFNAFLLGALSLLALALTLVGLYGVMSYGVAQRTREIGVRMALGAQTGDVLKMVVREGMALTLVGVSLGLAGAFAVTRFLRQFLYDVSPTDPLTLAFVTALLTLVAFLACWIPARRATKVDPLVALRYE